MEVSDPPAVMESVTKVKASTNGKSDVITEHEENDMIKTTTKELEVVILFINYPQRKVYIR